VILNGMNWQLKNWPIGSTPAEILAKSKLISRAYGLLESSWLSFLFSRG
jgi:hypothetical protein